MNTQTPAAARKIALVTGSSRGLGRNMVQHLARQGVDTVITYRRNRAEAETLAAEVHASGATAAVLQLDVADSASFAAFAQALKAVLKTQWQRERFDCLVNNAGIGVYASFADTSEAQFDELFRIHLKGPYFLTQALLPLISDGGRILNVSSGLARFSMPGFAAYAAMKGGVEVLTRYMAAEFGARGIRVNTLAPGAIETDFGGGLVRDTPEVNQHLAALTALGRVGLPDDIGGAVAALLADGSGWINGQRIEVAGGHPSLNGGASDSHGSRPDGLSHKGQFGLRFLARRLIGGNELAGAHAKQAQSAFQRHTLQAFARGAQDVGGIGTGALDGVVARGDLEIVVAQLDAYGLGDIAFLLQVVGQTLAQMDENLRKPLAVAARMQVALESGFAADGLGFGLGNDRALVDAMGGIGEPGAVAAPELGDQDVARLRGQFAYGRYPQLLEFCAGLGADAVDLAGGQRPDARGQVFRHDNADAGGLVQVGGDLGDQLAMADADGARQPGGVAYRLPESVRQRFAVFLDGAEVDVDLIYAAILDQRRDLRHCRLEQA